LAGFVTTATAVLLAYAGMGVFALVLAQVARRFAALVAMRLSVGSIQLEQARPKRWPKLLRPAAWLMVTTFFASVYQTGPNFILGIMSNPSETGYFVWGLGLSLQLVYLLATNMHNIFFPTFAKLSHLPERQFTAFHQTAGALTAVIAPVCALQIVTAEPLIRFIFPSHWSPAVPVVMWLSFGLMTQPLSVLVSSILRAQGKFGRLTALMAMQAVILVIAAIIGGCGGTAATMACACGVGMFVGGVIAGWLCYTEFGQAWRFLFSSSLKLILLSALSGGCAWSVSQQLHFINPVWQLLILIAVTVITYSLLLVSMAADQIKKLTILIKLKNAK
jgi:O-antigen/teichoic acid export membrane protein